jgi:hypothetical protein
MTVEGWRDGVEHEMLDSAWWRFFDRISEFSEFFCDEFTDDFEVVGWCPCAFPAMP